MATRLTFRQWDGGDGTTDRFINLFDLKESPQEVLTVLFKNHALHSYKGVPTPVDTRPYNNAEGLIIKDIPLEDDYSREVISVNGLSIYQLDAKRIRGYDYSIGRSPMIFEKALAQHIHSELGPKMYYGFKGLEKMLAVNNQNYICLRNTEIIAKLKKDDEKLVYTYPIGEEATKYFVASEWVKKQEARLQIIFEIAQVILDIKDIEELVPLYKKHYEEKKFPVY